MYSPRIPSSSHSDSHLRSLLISSRNSLSPSSFLASERAKIAELTESFSQSLQSKLADNGLKSPRTDSVRWAGDPTEPRKLILSRGENYAKFVLGQIHRSEENKQIEAAKVQQSVNTALLKLDAYKTEERDRLLTRVQELKKGYQTKVARLERRVVKEVEQLKGELTDAIEHEESTSFERIREMAEKLTLSIAPETKKAVISKVFGRLPSPPRPPPSSKPVFLDYSAAERKRMSQTAMRQLSESRRRVMQLNSDFREGESFRSERSLMKSSPELSDMRVEDLSDEYPTCSSRGRLYDE